MRRLILGFAATGLVLTATATLAAEPVTLTCTGRRNAPDPSTGAMKAENVSFQVRIDPKTRQLLENGKVMVIRDWSDRRIVYSDFNPGILGALAGGVVTTLDRKTDTWRDKWGGGRCKVSEGR